MSHQVKTIILLVILIVIIIVGWLWYGMWNSAPAPVPQASNTNSVQSQQSASAINADGGLTTSASDTSDAALESDLNSVDTQMSASNADNASVNQSLNQ